ncbi:MAG: endolytic transglycosylase MltG [Bacteroidetes bacterium]|nr:endolytic transglycosylase MltG [Bacteroidota bacterium]
MKKKILPALAGIILTTGGYISYKLFKPAVDNKDGLYFYIREGETPEGIKQELVNSQFLKKESGFDLACTVLRFKKSKPGRYLLKDGMSVWKLVRMLRSGEQALVKLTIVKERTKEMFSGKMGGKKFDLQFDSLQMISYLNNNDSLKKFGVDTNTTLSVIIPDTYLHKWNSTPDRLMQQLYAAYKKFWSEERTAKASRWGFTPQQIMILASIVEEETNRKDDKYNIASVYINRLRKGMRLQADPTVKFVTRNFQLGRITGVHLKQDSPYNTYLHEGLPPGPICTPSVESIEAVLNAPETGYLFFVASYKFDGSSIFTTNLNDHNKNARMFHAEQNRRTDSIRKIKENSASK